MLYSMRPTVAFWYSICEACFWHRALHANCHFTMNYMNSFILSHYNSFKTTTYPRRISRNPLGFQVPVKFRLKANLYAAIAISITFQILPAYGLLKSIYESACEQLKAHTKVFESERISSLPFHPQFQN